MHKFLLILTCVLALVGCGDRNASLKMIAESEENEFAQDFLKTVRDGDYNKARSLLDTGLDEKEVTAGLKSLHDALAQGDLLSMEPTGYKVLFFNGEKTMDFYYQARLSGTRLTGNVQLSRKGDRYFVRSSHFRSIPDSLEEQNRFSLQGKSPLHYLVLGLCVIIPLFIIYVLILCIRTRVRRKWLWIVFILLGVVQFQFNWATGGFQIQPLTVALLGATALQSGPYAPWVLSFAIPLGAVVFLIRRKVLRLTLS